MKENLGFRIINEIERPAEELINQFRGIPSSNINDTMNRMFCMRNEIFPMNDKPLVGPAVTVKAPMGDNLIVHKALDVAQAGDIIVIDGEGCTDRSLMGEMMLTFAERKGIAGFVIDGAIRDSDYIRKANIPLYCKGVTPQGPFRNGPGEINTPISCGGQVIFPGDILVGDGDGIVVIKPEFANEVLLESKVKHQEEVEKLKTRAEDAQFGNLFSKHEQKYSDIFERLGGQILKGK